MRKNILVGWVVVIALIWLRNTPVFMQADAPDVKLIAHRGVHQTFSTNKIGRDDCTAIMVEDTGHAYLENTIASMQAAFAYGTDVVEIDIQPTVDGKFVVFHDWALDCRTNGRGDIRKKTLAELQKLDVGYGYTFDGRETYPFLGTGVGAMPTLVEVFTAFPDGKFLINYKGNQSKEGRGFVALMQENPAWLPNVWGVYGGVRPTDITMAALGIRGYSRQSIKACLKDYTLKGWSGYVPKSCRNTLVVVPQNYAKFMWGWPHKFTDRMGKAGSSVILLGPHNSCNAGSTGIDNADSYDKVPENFEGFVWTNKIETIGPLANDVADDWKNGN